MKKRERSTNIAIVLFLSFIVAALLYVIVGQQLYLNFKPEGVLSCASFGSYEEIVDNFCDSGMPRRLDRNGDGVPCEDQLPRGWPAGPVCAL